MRFLSILIAIFVFLTPISVNAACYNAAEAEAEQGIRIHSELMIHTLRTDFANKTSTDAAKMRPDVFCANFAPRIPQVGKMSRSEFQQWAASTSRTEALSQSRCN